MTILEIQGIKCSAKSFQIEVELKQMMVLQPADIFEKCIIKTSIKKEPDQASEVVSDMQCDDSFPLHIENDRNDSNDRNMEINIVLKEDDLIEPTSQCEPFEPTDPSDIVIIVPKASLDNDFVNQEQPQIDKENKNILEQTTDEDYLEEVEFNLEELTDSEPLVIKKRDNIYYEMYKDAKKKAKNARDLALSAYLEAKRIKNTYMLEDIEDESDDSEDDEDDESDEDDDEDENEEDDDEGGDNVNV